MIFLFIVIFFNLWIYKILIGNIFLGVLLILATLLLYRYLTKKNKKVPIPLVLCFTLVLFSQVRTTQPAPLFSISNDNRRVIDMRLRAYPSSYLRVGYWLEERKESIAFFRITTNFFENLDPNLYFFANHPRERVGIKEFEKFPYFLLPLFIVGIFSLILSRKYIFFLTFFLLPLTILSFIGNKNLYGPFLLFPFIVTTMANGLEISYQKTKKLPQGVLYLILAVSLLIFIQLIKYEIY